MPGPLSVCFLREVIESNRIESSQLVHVLPALAFDSGGRIRWGYLSVQEARLLNIPAKSLFVNYFIFIPMYHISISFLTLFVATHIFYPQNKSPRRK